MSEDWVQRRQRHARRARLPQLHRALYSAAVRESVRQRLLDDAIGGEIERTREAAPLSVDDELDGQPALRGVRDQLVEPRQVCSQPAPLVRISACPSTLATLLAAMSLYPGVPYDYSAAARGLCSQRRHVHSTSRERSWRQETSRAKRSAQSTTYSLCWRRMPLARSPC